MRQTKTVKIRGVQYTLTQLGAATGRKVLLRVAKVVGPLMAASSSAEALAAAVLGDISDADLDFVCDAFSECTRMQMTTQAKVPTQIAVPFDFDEQFAGNYSAMLEWLSEHFQLNFSSFLAEIGETMGRLQATVKESLSPGGSIPISGESSSQAASGPVS